MSSGPPESPPPPRSRRERSTSASQLDHCQLAADALAAVPGVTIESTAELGVLAELKMLAQATYYLGRSSAGVELAEARAEMLAARADLDRARAYNQALRTLIRRFLRGDIDRAQLAKAITESL